MQKKNVSFLVHYSMKNVSLRDPLRSTRLQMEESAFLWCCHPDLEDICGDASNILSRHLALYLKTMQITNHCICDDIVWKSKCEINATRMSHHNRNDCKCRIRWFQILIFRLACMKPSKHAWMRFCLKKLWFKLRLNAFSWLCVIIIRRQTHQIELFGSGNAWCTTSKYRK